MIFYHPHLHFKMNIIEIIFIVIIISFFIFSLYQLKKAKQIKIKKHVNQLYQINKLKSQFQSISTKVNTIVQSYNSKKQDLQNIENKIQNEKEKRQKIIKQNQQRIKNFQEISKNASSNYIKILQTSYNEAENTYKKKINNLQIEYNQTAAELQKIKDTKKAAYQVLLKEKELKANADNYRLLPSSSDLSDINSLLKIKKELHKPRILSMLVWQTFWQPLAKQKFPIILKSKTKTGIYKITNIITNQCYIGQSLDIYKRWNEHCKAGLGIDTPPGNKLYKAIQEYGLQNFTFQLLIECNKDELNDKEKYFIQLYQSNDFGYNGTGGNK